MLHTHLQRVVHSDGRIAWECAAGQGRTDLLIEPRRGGGPGPARTQEHVIECKVGPERTGLGRLIREGRRQTAAHMDRCGAESGNHVAFEPRPGRKWEERMSRRDAEPGGLPVAVWGT